MNWYGPQCKTLRVHGNAAFIVELNIRDVHKVSRWADNESIGTARGGQVC
jgi:hypothetical protein